MTTVKVRVTNDSDGRVALLIEKVGDPSSYVIVREGEPEIFFDLNGGWLISSVANEVKP